MNKRSLTMVGVSALALMVAGLPKVSMAAAPATGADENDADTIIVTGTRDINVKAVDSPTPIQVVSADTLAATGANNAFDALKDILPSFSASAMSFDSSELIRSARLRGMNPGEVLVLVNGKRRHNSANVNADQDPDTSSNPADLDMIPVDLIDHVEVLEAGAAAQYGSDAVAGVINIILKSGASGTSLNAGGGITTRGDGAQGNAGFNQGIAIGNDGSLDVTVDYRHQDFMSRSNLNCKTYLNGCPAAGAGLPGGPGEVNIYGVTNGPVKNRILGAPLEDITTAGVNFEKPINDDATLYAFGTVGYRSARAYENNRQDSKAPFIYPDGFFPRETLSELDGAITVGVKGDHLFGGWSWDVSATYGQDNDKLGVIDSINLGLYGATGQIATQGTLGQENTSQTTVTADFRRGFEVGLAGPLNIAAGAEFRYETYSLSAGDPGTWLDGGTQSEAGFTPTDASNSNRNVEAVYVDLSTKPLTKWTVDLAGRFEDYSQTGVGSTETGKLTTRYDFTPQIGIRGTVSTGFHAPTLAQSNFSAANVTPSSFSAQVPVDSPGAKLLGAQPLKPETSKDIDVGIVLQPIDKAHITVDAYQVFLDHRIINSGAVGGVTGTPGEAIAIKAANANGAQLSAALASSVFATFFNNGVDTRTRGIDLTADYKSDFGKYGQVKWMLNGNVNNVAITKAYAGSPQYFLSTGATNYLNPGVITDLTKSSPANKFSLAPNWFIGDFDITLRETRYGHSDEKSGASSAIIPFENIYIKSAYITDVDIGLFVTDGIKLDIGGNNVFDHMPSKVTYLENTARNAWRYPPYTPWGIAGAYFYSRVSVTF